MTLIYHITSRDAALWARQTGEYRTESLAQDGFIHLSQHHQILSVANAFYAGKKELVILVVETSRLKAKLKYEAPVHPSASTSAAALSEDARFPHLYGPLNLDAVVKAVNFPPLANGRFELPAEISDQK
jgi:uncharacterized protein (DUF952 family)